MSNDFSDFIVRLVFDSLCYPVRDRHPVIVIAYVLALFAGIVAIGYGVTRLIPQSPY